MRNRMPQIMNHVFICSVSTEIDQLILLIKQDGFASKMYFVVEPWPNNIMPIPCMLCQVMAHDNGSRYHLPFDLNLLQY